MLNLVARLSATGASTTAWAWAGGAAAGEGVAAGAGFSAVHHQCPTCHIAGGVLSMDCNPNFVVIWHQASGHMTPTMKLLQSDKNQVTQT